MSQFDCLGLHHHADERLGAGRTEQNPPLTREQRRELQRRLTAQGYDVGEPDGKIGSKTREAIKSVEQQLGMRPTGRAGGKVLNALR